jgi:hypothetical protein
VFTMPERSKEVAGMIYSLILALVVIWPICRIVSKAGYSGAWGLLAIVPVVNIVALWALAFMEWPNGRR